jgi:hypothetical protein
MRTQAPDKTAQTSAAATRASSTLDCNELGVCDGACQDSDQECTKACLNRSSPSARTKFSAELACSKAHCAAECTPMSKDCVACRSKNCSTEAISCAADSEGTAARGTVGCALTFACNASCTPEDSSCTGRCIQKGSTASQKTLASLISCVGGDCAKDCREGESCLACIENNCSNSALACFGDQAGPAEGGTTCSQVFECERTCGADDSACLRRCGQEVSFTGALLLGLLASCGGLRCQDACAADNFGPSCRQCLFTHCAKESSACAADQGRGSLMHPKAG